VAIVNKTGCCDCGQLVDACSCGAAKGTTECRFKSGAAEICGIPEFADPPEHWFRRRQTTGTMTLSRYLDSVCSGEISVSAGLECRSKESTGTLIGFSEFGFDGLAPSDPPRKYRRKVVAGRIYSCQYGGSLFSCHGNNVLSQRAEYELSGAAEYDKDTAAFSNAMVSKLYRVDSPGVDCGAAAGLVTLNSTEGVSSDFPTNSSNWPSNFPGGTVACTSTQLSAPLVWSAGLTEAVFGNAGDCVSCGGTTAGPTRGIVSTPITTTLDEEDTEQDAIDRAGGEMDWGGAGDCSSQYTYKDTRGSGDFSFGFRQVQSRIVVSSGLTSGANYEGRIIVGKRTAGSMGSFVDTGTPIMVFFTASGSGHTSDWQDLPQEDGFEYQAIGVEVYGEIATLTVDAWDIEEVYNSGTCVQALDNNSTRTVDGDPGDDSVFDDIPPDVYGGLAGVSTSPTIRTTTGNDTCLSDGLGSYVQANGTVQEQLSDEDTDQDAATRAMNGITDWIGGGCDLPAFITGRTPGNKVFGFRWLNVRGQLQNAHPGGGAPSKTYHLTWKIYRRQNGSSLAYQYYGDLVQEVTVTTPVHTTDWIDVPNEAGWDTKVGALTVTLVA